MSQVPAEALDLEQVSAPLTVGSVARRLGVAPATLRTWDRRYGLGPSEHQPGTHRRYTASDFARLETMQRLLMLGSTPADAARAALSAGVADVADVPFTQAADAAQTAESEGRQADVVPIGITSKSARGLARAAAALDHEACLDIIAAAIARQGVIAVWNDLLVPVLIRIGQQWQASGNGAEVEHLLSEAILSAMHTVVREAPEPINQRTVLLASAPDDLHTLALFTVAAALSERRISSRCLGARVPHESLLAAAERTGPGAVFVWSQLPETGDIGSIGDLLRIQPAPLVLLGGPGWNSEDFGSLQPVSTLGEAVNRISRAVCL
jgi:MerR family transcriptional regulator, light-induced transcriptional regulator